MASIRARHNYNSVHTDEVSRAGGVSGPTMTHRPLPHPQLSFKKKDVLTLVDKMGNKGWWKARAPSGKEGLVPGASFFLFAL